jgi:hypothetical protein
VEQPELAALCLLCDVGILSCFSRLHRLSKCLKCKHFAVVAIETDLSRSMFNLPQASISDRCDFAYFL